MSERQRVVRSKATPDVWFQIGLADEEPFIDALRAAPEVESFDLYFDEGDEAHTPSSLFYVWLKPAGEGEVDARDSLTRALRKIAMRAHPGLAATG